MAGCDLLNPETTEPVVYKGEDGQGGEGEGGGGEVVEGVAQPKGAVKTIESVFYEENSHDKMWGRTLMTIIYDAQGRPSREDYMYYGYSNGVLQTTRKGNSFYYLFSDGKMELRSGKSTDDVVGKSILNSDGLVVSTEEGYIKNGSWVSNGTRQFSYTDGKCTALTDPRESFTYTWRSDGALDRALDKKTTDIDESGTQSYIYDGTVNPSYGHAYDVSGIIFSKVGEMGGYRFNGKGSSLLPKSANTLYRNEARVFSYVITNGKVTKITEQFWPFADSPGVKNVKYYDYLITYYE